MARNTVSPRLGIPIPVGSDTRKRASDARGRMLEFTGGSPLLTCIANGRMLYYFASKDLDSHSLPYWLMGAVYNTPGSIEREDPWQTNNQIGKNQSDPCPITNLRHAPRHIHYLSTSSEISFTMLGPIQECAPAQNLRKKRAA